MDLSKMTPEEARAIVTQAQNVFDASIADQQRTSPKEIQSLPLDLTVGRSRANALKLSFPFKSLFMEQATDINTFVYVIPISNDTGNDPIRMGLRDIYKNEFGFRECYIYWDAQSSKSVVLKFFVRSFLENGRLVLDQNSVGVNLNIGEGSSQNDGFTIIQTVFGNGLPSPGFLELRKLLAMNDSAYNNGTYTILGAPNTNNFLVPQGYTAEVVGAELTVQTAIASTSWDLYLYAIPNNAVYATELNIPVTASICYAQTYATTGLPLTNQPIKKIMQVDTANSGRKKRIFNSGEIIIGVISNNQSGNTGVFAMNILIRLTKTVG